MAHSQTHYAARFPLLDRGAPRETPAGPALHKLDRLRELRAVIETLRCERQSPDPLLSWIVERETHENHRRD